jgi:hypothetical protein
MNAKEKKKGLLNNFNSFELQERPTTSVVDIK